MTIVLVGLIVYFFTRKKYQEEEEDEPVLEMHNEALELLNDVAEEEHDEITMSLKSETPEADLAARINSKGGPL